MFSRMASSERKPNCDAAFAQRVTRRIGRKHSIITCAALMLALIASTGAAWANLIIDPSFETESNPLPGLGPVVGPPFAPGFWGVENATIVTAELGITPRCDSHMLRMEDEGLTVTQAFQAIDVSADSVCIDSGHASITLSAWLNTWSNTGLPPVVGGVLVFFYPCASCWGNSVPYISDNQSLGDAGSWTLSTAAGAIPPGTRWVLAQLGFSDATLLGRPGYVDCVDMQVFTGDCGSTPVVSTTWGRVKGLYK